MNTNFSAIHFVRPIDKRRTYFIVYDTETAIPAEWIVEGMKKDELLRKSVPYNIGAAVVDKHGTVYAYFTVVISKIFFDRLDMMNSCYYANKRAGYLDQIENNQLDVVESMWDVKALMNELVKTFSVRAIVAHKHSFDYTACKNGMIFAGAKKPYFLPYGVELWDTMRMAESTICKTKTYKKWCADNGYMTKNNQVRKTAEILYRFITNDNTFEEAHTAYEDVTIEKEILAACYRTHKAMKRNAFSAKKKEGE